MRQKTYILTFLTGILAFTILGCTTMGPAGPMQADSPAADIQIFREKLPNLHANLFHTIDREEYFARLDTIEAGLENLSDTEIDIELRRLLADVGDSHTVISYNPARLFPFTFKHFAEGTFLLAASPQYKEYVGMQLVSINGTGTGKVIQKLAEIIPHENEAQLWSVYPQFLVNTRILKGLEIIKNGEAALQFEDGEGRLHSVTVTDISVEENIDWVTLLGDIAPKPQSVDAIPLYLRDTKVPYRYTYLPEENLLYLQYNSCRNMEGMPFRRFFEKLKTEVLENPKAYPISKLVVDVRFNGGGNSTVLWPLINYVKQDAVGGRKYDLFCIIGRATFSSAVLNAIDLEQKADAILVGEPSGGKPNHYGEVRTITLPYSGRTLQYSTNYFDRYEKDTDSLYPDIEVLWQFGNLIRWKDGAMEEIRAY